MPDRSDASADRWGRYLIVLSLVAAVATVGVLVSGLWTVPPIWLWLIFAVILVALLAGLGKSTNGSWLGILIDSRNRMSLSRLQIALWTVMILSAYVALALPCSMASTLISPTAQDVERCKAAHIQEMQGISDLSALGLEDRREAE
jgi:MFS family permease